MSLINFDPRTGGIETPFSRLVQEASEKIARERKITPSAAYPLALEQVMSKDSEFGNFLSDQHKRLVDAFNTRDPYNRLEKFGLRLEAHEVREAIKKRDEFISEQAMESAGKEIVNANHPFVRKIEEVLKRDFAGDRVFIGEATSRAGVENPDLALSYLRGTFPNMGGELQRIGGPGSGTTNRDYPRK